MNIKIKKLNDNAVIPSYAKNGDMGMDVTAISIEYDKKIDCYIYHTGLAFEIPEGYGMLIFPRSSNRKTNYYLANSVGVLDSGYRGELLICFKNRDSIMCTFESTPPYLVGDRVAQIMILPYPKIEFIESEELSDSERKDGGFGSTNK